MSKEDVVRALEQSKNAVAGDRVKSGLVGLLDEVEATLGRALETDELQSAGRALRAGLSPEDVAKMFEERPADIPDGAVKVHAAILEGRTFKEL